MVRLLRMNIGNRLIVLLLFISLFLFGQEESSFWKDKFSYSGYLKYLNTATSFDKTWTHNQLIHNRFNTRVKWSKNLQSGIELRNRILYGDANLNSAFYESLDDDNGLINTSFAEQGRIGAPILSVQLDRWWLRYDYGKWELNAGRQRINWGVNFLWNVNDVFNAYNFSDFDYEERPGSDAVMLTRYIGDLNELNIAYSPTRDLKNYSLASRYRWNKNSYDYQILIGKVINDAFLGFAWDGSLKNIGFKGELSSFYSTESFNTYQKDSLVLTGSFSLDYTWQNGWMLMGGYYFNSSFLDVSEVYNNLGQVNSTAKALLPLPHALFIQAGKSLGALWRADIVLLGLPTRGAFIMPTVSYSVSESIDLSFVDQIILIEGMHLAQSMNMRLKWSF